MINTIIVIILTLSLSHCTKEIYDLSIPDNNVPLIQKSKHTYSLIERNTGKSIGRAVISFRHYITDNRLFYQLNSKLNLQWKTQDYNKKKQLLIENESIIDNRFRLHSFKGKIVKDGKISLREGFYKPPFFYIIENGKKSRIRASKGIFSQIVDQYFIRNELEKQGDAAVYHYLNLNSLRVEEIRILFEKKGVLKVNEKQMPVRVYVKTNYTSSYYEIKWVNKQNKLLQKTDFREAIIWKIDS